MNIDLKVAQMLVSRVCHDLSGGVGALSTGAELLVEDGSAGDDAALNLIVLSAKQTTARLQFLRMAFGLGAGQSSYPSITTAEILDLFQNYIVGGRISIKWNSENVQMGLQEGKLLLNLCLIATEALPRGGQIEVDVSELDQGLGFGLSATGENAHLLPQLQVTICEEVGVEALTPRNVHGHFTAVLAAKLRAQLEVSAQERGEVRLAALLPVSRV